MKERSEAIKAHRTSYKHENIFTGKLVCGNDGAHYWMKQRSLRGREDLRWVCSKKIRNGADTCSSFALRSELKSMVAN